MHDSGPGIAQAELELVFERTYRSHKSRPHDAGGSSLGRAIAKSIAEAHGGAIHAGSVAGEGTTMIVRLHGGPAA